MERLLQNFNYAGGNRRIALPHLTVRQLRCINWNRLKNAGIKGCVFDKDNTLTRPFQTELATEVVESLVACREAFGDAVVLFSNSAGLEQYDPEGREAAALERALGIHVLRHREKKPSGTVRELESHFGCKSEALVMVGDRLLTDVVFGNLNGMLTIYVHPFDTQSEPLGVQLVPHLPPPVASRQLQGRVAENRLWTDCQRKGLQVWYLARSWQEAVSIAAESRVGA